MSPKVRFHAKNCSRRSYSLNYRGGFPRNRAISTTNASHTWPTLYRPAHGEKTKGQFTPQALPVPIVGMEDLSAAGCLMDGWANLAWKGTESLAPEVRAMALKTASRRRHRQIDSFESLRNGSLVRRVDWLHLPNADALFTFAQRMVGEFGRDARAEPREFSPIAGKIPDGILKDVLANVDEKSSMPRLSQMLVYALNSALYTSGLDWIGLFKKYQFDPYRVKVCASSAVGDLLTDFLITAQWLGLQKLVEPIFEQELGKNDSRLPLAARKLAKNLMSEAVMYVLSQYGIWPADTSGHAGACALHAFNLENAVNSIRRGDTDIAFVITGDAGIYPWWLYAFKGAMATQRNFDRWLKGADPELRARLDADPVAGYQSWVRGLGQNPIGMAMSEGVSVYILMHPKLAAEVGALVYGSVGTIATGVSGPGVGLTGMGPGLELVMDQGVNSTVATLGVEGLEQRTRIYGHTTGTAGGKGTQPGGVWEAKGLAASLAREGISTADHPVRGVPFQSMMDLIGHSEGPSSGNKGAAALQDMIYETSVGSGNLNLEGPHKEIAQLSQLRLIGDPEKTDVPIDVSLIISAGFGDELSTVQLISSERTRQAMRNQHVAGSEARNWNFNRKDTERRLTVRLDEFLGGQHFIKHGRDAPRLITERGHHVFQLEGLPSVDLNAKAVRDSHGFQWREDNES